MTIEEKEAFLRSYRECDMKIQTVEHEIESLRQTMLVNGYHMSDLPKHSNNTDDKMADYASVHLKLCKRVDGYIQRKLDVIDSINSLSDRDSECGCMLSLIFVRGMSKAEAGRTLCMSKATRIRKYRKAIDLFEVKKG